jgi:predicted phage-related endonuclease
MLRGEWDEVEARIKYREHFGPVTECGFITNDDHGFVIGYSPDGLVDDDGLIECKSRRQKFQVETILSDAVPAEYMLQIQTGLLVTRRKWLDFVSYCAGLPMFIKRVFPDARYQEAIIAAATDFERRLQEAQQKYAAWLDRQPVVINTVRTIQEEITC